MVLQIDMLEIEQVKDRTSAVYYRNSFKPLGAWVSVSDPYKE